MLNLSITDLPSGSIIGSYNIPYKKFLRPDTKTMKSSEELKKGTENVYSFLYLPYGLWILIILLTFLIFIPVFQEAGVDLDKPIVATCWIVMAGLLCGMKSVPLYNVS